MQDYLLRCLILILRIFLQMFETVNRGSGEIADQTGKIGMLPYFLEITGGHQPLIYMIERIVVRVQRDIVPLELNAALKNVLQQSPRTVRKKFLHILGGFGIITTLPELRKNLLFILGK